MRAGMDAPSRVAGANFHRFTASSAAASKAGPPLSTTSAPVTWPEASTVTRVTTEARSVEAVGYAAVGLSMTFGATMSASATVAHTQTAKRRSRVIGRSAPRWVG